MFDRNGEPRAAVTVGGGISEVYWRDAGKEGWRSLRKGPASNETWHPIAVDASDTLYVVAPSPASTSVLKRFDFAAGAPEPEPIVSTPGFDAYTGLVFEGPERKRLVGIRVNTDAETTVWFDPERKKLQALVDARFPTESTESPAAVPRRGCLAGPVVLGS